MVSVHCNRCAQPTLKHLKKARVTVQQVQLLKSILIQMGLHKTEDERTVTSLSHKDSKKSPRHLLGSL